MKVLESNGAIIHYAADIVSADAKTLVFINSLGSDFRIWDGVVDALGGRYNLLRHDKRGHGLSSLGDRAIGIPTYADDVQNLLRLVGARNVVLVGLSVGGLIAQELMQRAGLDIKAAVLSNTGLKIGSDEMWNSRITDIETQGLEQISHGVMERWFSPAFRTRQSASVTAYRTMLSRTPAAGYLACCRAIRDAQGFDHHNARRQIPTLCLGGSLDGSTAPALVKAMAANIAGAHYVEFDGTGHLPCIEQPGPYAAAITDFLAAI